MLVYGENQITWNVFAVQFFAKLFEIIMKNL